MYYNQKNVGDLKITGNEVSEYKDKIRNDIGIVFQESTLNGKLTVEENLTNFTRDRLRLLFTIFMSGFFLFIFSFVMKPTTAVEQPLNHLISGVIIMTVFQATLTNSTSIIEDMSMGFMKEVILIRILSILIFQKEPLFFHKAVPLLCIYI